MVKMNLCAKYLRRRF